MRKAGSRIAILAGQVLSALRFLAAVAIFFLMALVFISVFFRYVLNSPLLAGADYLAILLGLMIFSAYPSVCRNRLHISVDVLTARFARYPRFNAARLAFIDIFVISMTVYMAVCVFEQAEKYQRRDTTLPMTGIPLAPVTQAFVFLLLVAALLLAIRTVFGAGNQAGNKTP